MGKMEKKINFIKNDFGIVKKVKIEIKYKDYSGTNFFPSIVDHFENSWELTINCWEWYEKKYVNWDPERAVEYIRPYRLVCKKEKKGEISLTDSSYYDVRKDPYQYFSSKPTFFSNKKGVPDIAYGTYEYLKEKRMIPWFILEELKKILRENLRLTIDEGGRIYKFEDTTPKWYPMSAIWGYIKDKYYPKK